MLDGLSTGAMQNELLKIYIICLKKDADKIVPSSFKN